jgi:hypothetical protein
MTAPSSPRRSGTTRRRRWRCSPECEASSSVGQVIAQEENRLSRPGRLRRRVSFVHMHQAVRACCNSTGAQIPTASGFAQEQRCGSAEPRQPRDARIPGERSSRWAASRRCLWRPSASPAPGGVSRDGVGLLAPALLLRRERGHQPRANRGFRSGRDAGVGRDARSSVVWPWGAAVTAQSSRLGRMRECFPRRP